ncbi:unnamed protein product [Clonostachys rhizophaga]|uniref:Zn(2)-C6 fungal-type domain-containing protein n=1 Tax=Clonostachys rhizophaga TaxID=160324 RepID=A0A9N9VAY6_9HYPO|nr:unnamed protein product [Clonostachys rhizophaga]
MPPDQLASSVHRFRVRQPAARASRRSASPPLRRDEAPSSSHVLQQSPSTNGGGSGGSGQQLTPASSSSRRPSSGNGLSRSSTAASAGAASSPRSGKERTPACDRCRSFKKKCSRTFPVCSLCASAGHTCSFSTPATSPGAQTLHLRARIEWLTSFINNNVYVPGLDGVQSIDTGTDLESLLGGAVSPYGSDKAAASASINASSNAASKGSSGSRPEGIARGEMTQFPKTQPHHEKGSMPAPGLPHDRTPSLVATVNSDSPVSCHSRGQMTIDGSPNNSIATPGAIELMAHGEMDHSNLTVLAQDTLARRLVDAYFRNIHKAYPFINKAKLLRNADVIGTLARKRGGADSTLLYLVMALGCTTLQRAGQIPQDVSSTFHISYSDIIQECLTRQDEVEALQILVLLALYALFDPKGTSTWSITGLAARQAMLAGLSRKEPDEKVQASSAMDIEFRYRLFWSIFVLDRMVAISLGIQVALVDENMDVPLPGLTIDEFASPERQQYASMLQTNRHVIHLRQLEDRILQQIHTRKESEVAALSQADRQAIAKEIKSEVENWYSNGCLASPLETDNVPIHSSVTWLSARYYHLLLLLHYPCHFNSSGSIISPAELFRLAQKHLQSTSVLLQQRQLPLNRVTLCRIFPVGLILLHCFLSCPVDCVSYSARDDVAVIVSILEAFPEGWLHARQAVQIFRRLMNLVSSKGSSTAGFMNVSTGYYETGLKAIIDEFLALMRQVLGRSTCYALYKFPDDAGAQDSSSSTTASGMNGTNGQTLSSLPVGPAMHVSGATSMPNDEYNWTNLELGFL